MSQYGLAKQTGVSNEEAKVFIEKYFIAYPKIEEFMKAQVSFAKTNGYIKTLFDRRRYIKNIDSSNRMDRENAERMAINSPIQGTAADIIKLAMIEVDKLIRSELKNVKMVMQIHDELVFYIKNDEIEDVEKIKSLMEEIISDKIDLVVDAGIGENWMVAK